MQIYLRYHLGLPSNGNGFSAMMMTTQTERARFLRTLAQEMYYIDESSWSLPRFKVFKTLLGTQRNFCSVPCFDGRRWTRMQVDMIVQPSFLARFGYEDADANEEDPRPMIVLLTDSASITTYKKYKAHFAVYVLRALRKELNLSVVHFLDVRTQKLHTVRTNDAYTTSIQQFCRWIRFCQGHGELCTLFPPSHPFLYPNMKVHSGNEMYERWKHAYATQLQEITMLWGCHPTHRNRAHARGILGFGDERFCPSILGLSPKNEALLTRMLELYRSPSKTIDVPHPHLVWNTIRPMQIDCFVDFETLDGYIYWIGIGCSTSRGAYVYESIVASSTPSVASEREVMQRFVEWMKRWDGHVKTVYYWYAEVRFWNEAMRRHDDHHDEDLSMSMDDWVDLCALFRDAPILIKNAWNFKLKTLAKHMKDHGMIQIELPKGCQNGHESMIIAREFFETRSNECFEILKKYNHFDCTVMFEMVEYLRKIVMHPNKE